MSSLHELTRHINRGRTFAQGQSGRGARALIKEADPCCARARGDKNRQGYPNSVRSPRELNTDPKRPEGASDSGTVVSRRYLVRLPYS